MQYDFETWTNRFLGGSHKYKEMRLECPDLPPDTVPLSMADMEWQDAPAIIHGLKDYLDAYPMGYSSATPSYIEAVQGWMRQRHGLKVEADWIVPVPGVLPDLFATLQALTQPGDGIIYFSPVFGWFRNGTAMNGRTPVPCSIFQQDGSYSINFDRFERVGHGPEKQGPDLLQST